MTIEIVSLTDKGRALSYSVRQSPTPEWRVINYLGRMGGRATRDRLEEFAFNGDVATASRVLRNLQYRGYIFKE